MDRYSGVVSQEWGVPAPHQGSQLKVPVPGRQVPTTSECKNQWGLSRWKKLLESQAVPLKEPTHILTYSASLPQGPGTEVVAWGAPVVCRGRLRCLASRQAEAIVPFLGPPPQSPPVGWCHIWDSINLANPVWPTLEIPRDSAPHDLQSHKSCFSIWIAGLGLYCTTS